MRRIALWFVLSSGCLGCDHLLVAEGCTMAPCGLDSLPAGRSAACDADYPGTPGRLDHCVAYDGAQEAGALLSAECSEPWRVHGLVTCAPLRDAVIGAEPFNCEDGGQPARCFWIDTYLIETYGP